MPGPRIFHLLLLSVISAVLLILSWPPLPLSFLLFVAIVPLLELERMLEPGKRSTMVYGALVYVCFLIWNTGSTYWLYNTSKMGALLVHVLNPILLLTPMVFYRLIKIRWGQLTGNLALIAVWVAIEYFHHIWELSYPFLTLGNGLSMYPEWIQFYEYTGVLGGSVWIITVNILVFRSILKIRQNLTSPLPGKIRLAIGPLLVIILPACISLMIFAQYEDKGREVDVLVVHPNTDCRNEKYLKTTDELVGKYLDLTFAKLNHEVDYVLWPETAITNAGWVQDMNSNPLFHKLLDTLKVYSKTKLVTGAILYEVFKDSNNSFDYNEIPNIRYIEKSDIWYYTYNSSIQLDVGKQSLNFRTKSKLVPMEETIPYARKYGALRALVPSLGGYLFTTRPSTDHLFTSGDGIRLTSIICYESLFGDMVAEHVKRGANLIFISLNEGWYKDLSGASQFMYYSSVRAIETRRAVARSSNDGISCFINQKGEIVNKMDEFNAGALVDTLYANDELTLYASLGNYPGKACSFIALILLFGYLLSLFQTRNQT